MFKKQAIKEQAKSLMKEDKERYSKVSQEDLTNAIDWMDEQLLNSEPVWQAINECIVQCLDEMQKDKENKPKREYGRNA